MKTDCELRKIVVWFKVYRVRKCPRLVGVVGKKNHQRGESLNTAEVFKSQALKDSYPGYSSDLATARSGAD